MPAVGVFKEEPLLRHPNDLFGRKRNPVSKLDEIPVLDRKRKDREGRVPPRSWERDERNLSGPPRFRNVVARPQAPIPRLP